MNGIQYNKEKSIISKGNGLTAIKEIVKKKNASCPRRLVRVAL